MKGPWYITFWFTIVYFAFAIAFVLIPEEYGFEWFAAIPLIGILVFNGHCLRDEYEWDR